MSTAFDDVKLPDDIEQGAKGGPSFQTSIFTSTSGVEQRNATWAQTRAVWDIGYGIQSPEDLVTAESFYYERGGQARAFRFKDWHDHTATDEPIGTGNGTLRTFLLSKTYGTFQRRITRPVADTVSVKVNDVVVDPANYDVGLVGGWIKFHTGHEPANTAAVTASFEFDVPVRFSVDAFNITMYWAGAVEVPSVPIIEIRDIVNESPTVSLANAVTTMGDDTSTAAHVKIADVVVTDDPFGTNVLSLTGNDAASFELVGTLTLDGTGVSLYLKAGTVLDGSVKAEYDVTVNVSDASISEEILSSASEALAITIVPRAPTLALSNLDNAYAADQSTASDLRVADLVVTQHGEGLTGSGTNSYSLTGTDAASFHITGDSLYLTAGADNTHTPYLVTVDLDNTVFGSPSDHKDLAVTFGVVDLGTNFDAAGDGTFVVPEYTTLTVEAWGAGAGAPGFGAAGTDGGATTVSTFSMTAAGGKTSALTVQQGNIIATQQVWNTEGGDGGAATGGTTNTTGGKGGSGLYKVNPSNPTATSGAGGAAPSGGAGAAAVTATEPTAPSPLSTPAPPTNSADRATHVDGIDAVGPGDGGSGSASMLWTLILTLQDGYTWTLLAETRPGGGSGAHSIVVFNRGDAGAPAVGSTVNFHVGAKGVGGSSVASGGDGGHGRVRFTVA